jgi:hypothetical protein
VPKLPTVQRELGGAIRQGKRQGRLGPEHRVDLARARLLAGMLIDEATPRSAIAALDRRLDVILVRLGIVSEATGPTELAEWLAGLKDETSATMPALDADDDYLLNGPSTPAEFVAELDEDEDDDDDDDDDDPGPGPVSTRDEDQPEGSPHDRP